MVVTRGQQQQDDAALATAIAASRKDVPKAVIRRESRRPKKATSDRPKGVRKRRAVEREIKGTRSSRKGSAPQGLKQKVASKVTYKEDIPLEESETEDDCDNDYKPGSRPVSDFASGLALKRSSRNIAAPQRLIDIEQSQKHRCLPLISVLRRKSKNKAGRRKMKVVIRRVKFWQIPLSSLRRTEIKARKLPANYWPFPDHHFKLGHNAWEHTRLPAPTEAEVREVHRRLAEYNARFSVKSFVGRPAHAAAGSASVDNLIQTILSQSTGNLSAIDSHSRLCNAFPFSVDGKKYVGKMPNWHAIRLVSHEELERVLQPAGYQKLRAKAIKSILDTVWLENKSRAANENLDVQFDLNPPEAKDFVPGLLSIDYLESPKTISNNDLLGRLLSFPLIGPKSAMCIMDFAYKRPSFAVDTHVLRYCQWLGWVPAHASEEQAAMYLHSIVPDDIKFDLHNQIWTHCANESTRAREGGTLICPFCGANPPPKNKDFSNYQCPMADLLVPLSKRWLDKHGKSKYQEMTDEEKLSLTKKQLAKEERKRLREEKQISQPETPDLTPDVDTQTSVTSSASSESGHSKKESTKKWARTIDYANMTPQQAKENGYLLWEFRPLDNSFMQDWGTFGQLPRYKWEKPDIMDPDVAVTPAYADDVLAGRTSHKWSNQSDEVTDFIPPAALTAVADETPADSEMTQPILVNVDTNEAAPLPDADMNDA